MATRLTGPISSMRFCNAPTCSATGVPIRGRAAARHFFGRQRFNFGRAFIGESDRDAFAADVVEIDLIFLLNALRAGFARPCFSARVRLRSCRVAAEVRSGGGVARADFLRAWQLPLPAPAFWPIKFRSLRVHLLAFVLKRFDLRRDSAISDSACALRLMNDGNFAAALLRRVGSVRECAVRKALLLLAERSAKLFFGRESDFAFRQGRCWRRRAVGAVAPSALFSSVTCSCNSRSRSSKLVDLRGQAFARFCKPSCFLCGEALDFVNDRVDFLVQARAANFAAR